MLAHTAHTKVFIDWCQHIAHTIETKRRIGPSEHFLFLDMRLDAYSMVGFRYLLEEEVIARRRTCSRTEEALQKLA